MSGGSMEYICYKIEEYLCGKMQDAELNDLVKDIAKLAHQIEWATDGDIGMADYWRNVERFKNKWFKGNRQERLKGYVDEKLKETKDELYKLIGVDDGQSEN